MTALWLAASLAFAQEAPEFYAPLDQSSVAPGAVLVVVRSSGDTALTVDGKPGQTESPAPGVLRAKLNLTPGAHEITAKNRAGETRIRVFAGKPPEGFQPFRSHAPTASCDTCHAVKNGEWAMRRPSLAPICGTCHPKEQFPVIHTHNTDLLADCQSCHMPHGSLAAKLLRQPKEAACKLCHGQP